MFTTQTASSWRPHQNACTFVKELDTRPQLLRASNAPTITNHVAVLGPHGFGVPQPAWGSGPGTENCPVPPWSSRSGPSSGQARQATSWLSCPGIRSRIRWERFSCLLSANRWIRERRISDSGDRPFASNPRNWVQATPTSDQLGTAWCRYPCSYTCKRQIETRRNESSGVEGPMTQCPSSNRS